MFIGFDIGNTSTKMGLYHDDSPVPFHLSRYASSRHMGKEGLIDEMEKGLLTAGGKSASVTGLAFSSVVPELNKIYIDAGHSMFGTRPLEISHRCRLNISITYDSPSTLGVDRIVNAEAAFMEYGGDIIIIDIGTAATFCVLSGKNFDGGLIAPGYDIAKKSLAEYTSNLPEIKMGKPDRLVARDTVNAMKSGLFYGWISLTEGIIDRIEKEYKKPFNIIFTGGYSKIISENVQKVNIFDPMLTMKGIKHIYTHNT